MPLSTSAYIADTQHLALPQTGAYLLILMTMWRANGWIADDDRILASICKISVLKWRAMAPVLRPLLMTKDGKLSQKRLLIELEKATNFCAKARLNGSKGGKAKALKLKEGSLATATVSPAAPPAPSQGSPKNDSLFPSTDSETQAGRKKTSNRGTTLPSDWQPSASLVEYGLAQGLSKQRVEAAAEDMRLWALGNANRGVARKADWGATFQGWLRRIAEKNGGGNESNRASGDRNRGGFSSLAARRASEAFG
jgi:uncharacterized protein YdaU (DUF1376 family)